MRLRFACFILALAFEGLSLGAQESPPAPAPIDAILLRPNVWESTPQELELDLKNLRFEWISANQDVARSALPGLAFQKHSLNEAILSFRYGKLAEARLLYFNRGDSGVLREDQFEGLLAGITADLSALTGRQPTDRGRDPGSAVKAEGRIWETEPPDICLNGALQRDHTSKQSRFGPNSFVSPSGRALPRLYP